MKILVTGSAGFIGFHLARYLLRRGDEVVGIDNINEYYDVGLKLARLEETGITADEISYGKPVDSSKFGQYIFIKLDLTDTNGMQNLFENYDFDAVCHLAAQAGVRHSLTHPHAYIDSNIKGFLNVLECCRYNRIKHLLYASSSSVYGLNKEMPYATSQNTDHPVSLYAATKKSNELMAHTYSHLYELPTTALRFFTVYGPWGRPDMAPFLFTKSIIQGKSIDIFNNGDMKRDFTYIDDIIAGMIRVLNRPPNKNTAWDALKPSPESSIAPYHVYNIGRGTPLNLMDFITAIEKNLGKKAIKKFLPMQKGDVQETWADVEELKSASNYTSWVTVEEGVRHFIRWYKDFYDTDINNFSFE